MAYTELEHTADALFHISSGSLEELFEDAAMAMFYTMYGVKNSKEEFIHHFRMSADSHETLLRDFLSELLFITDTEQAVFTRFSVNIEGFELDCTAYGEPFDQEKHSGGTEVKGVSYSGLNIVKQKDRYVLDIIFDV